MNDTKRERDVKCALILGDKWCACTELSLPKRVVVQKGSYPDGLRKSRFQIILFKDSF